MSFCPTAERLTVLHFAESDDTSGFFPQLGRWHDRSRYRMLFGTLRPMALWLRDFMQREGVGIMSCDARSRGEYPAAALRLVRFLRREHVDIVHAHLFEPCVVGLAGAVAARTPVRVITRHYSNYHTRIGRCWHVRADRLCTRASHAVIAVSQHTADHLVDEEGTPREKVSVVLNGIDFDRLKISEPDVVERLRREYGVEDGYVLLVPARLHPEKGHTYFFRALPSLCERLTRPFVALVAGDGPFEAAYREEVRALGCQDVVRFLGFRRDMPDLIATADLVVLPSLAEAFGLVLAEALYLGTAVVATRVGGIPEVVEEGVDSALVPPADSRALAEAMMDLLTNPAKRRRLAGAGRERIRARFAFESMVRAYEGLYEHLAARPEQPGARA